jgi:hypothetical protein
MAPMVLCGLSDTSPIDDCSENVDKQGVDVARPECDSVFRSVVVSLTYLNFRRVKVKTEKAMYAEKVREDSSMK